MSDTQMYAALRTALGPLEPEGYFANDDDRMAAVIELEDSFGIEILDEDLEEHDIQTASQLVELAMKLCEQKATA